MATLTTYTQALQHIATQTFKPGQLFAFTFRADEPTCTVGIRGCFDPGIINGYVYGITVYGMADTIYASLKYMKATAEGDVLTFERLSPDAQGIVKAVLAELDTHEAKPEYGGRTLAETFGPDAFKPVDKTNTLAELRYMRDDIFTPNDWREWREGEGNNP